MAAGTCTYIICIKIYAIGRQILSSASLSGGLIIGCFFFVYRQFDLYLKGGAYKWGWVLITRSIFLFTGRWTYLLRRGGGGGAYKRGWGGAYKRQLTILYVNHDRGLFITNYNYNYQGRETLTARTISMLGSESDTTGRDAH